MKNRSIFGKTKGNEYYLMESGGETCRQLFKP